MIRLFTMCLLSIGLLLGCEDRWPLDDGGVFPDVTPHPDTLKHVGGMDLSSDISIPIADSKDFVISRIIIPSTTTVDKVGHDFDLDGLIDNSLGALLSALASTMKLEIQSQADQGVNGGHAPILLRITADNWQNDPTSTAQSWPAKKKTCCNIPQNLNTCAAEAKTKCFDGKSTFQATISKSDPLFKGKITNGKILYGPASMALNLPLGNFVLPLSLKAAYLKGDLQPTTTVIQNGILAGAIPKFDVDYGLKPQLAKWFDFWYQEAQKAAPNSPQQKKVAETLKMYFDSNKDKKISLDEIQKNQLISTFLQGDVDVDGDKQFELSFGVGFEAVGAIIQPL